MKTQPKTRSAETAIGLSLILLLAVAAPVRAALGGNAESIRSDQVRMKGELRSVAGAAYIRHEIQTEAGTAVREFAGPDGAVFGVAWEGPFLPDMRQLLGASFDSYTQAAQKKRHGRGPLLIQLPGLVIESTGHPRSFRGRAYLPELVPYGVTADDIR